MSFNAEDGVRAILTIIMNHGSVLGEVTPALNKARAEIAALSKLIKTLDRRIMRMRHDAKIKRHRKPAKAPKKTSRRKS